MNTTTKSIYIVEKNSQAQKVLNACLVDIAKVENFAKTGEITIKDKDTKTEISFKVESDILTEMADLSETLKDKTLKYAFDKKRMFKAKRQLTQYLKENTTKA